MVSDYVNSLAPHLSDTWHADEVFVKTRGGSTVSVRGRGEGEMTIGYLWNVMDRKTRFLLASELTKFRDVGGADRVFRKVVANAHENRPVRVFTDGLKAYNDAVKFSLPHSQHVPKAGLKKPHASNNRIERLNGTVRERVKVQRGWKSLKTPLAEGQRIHCNFVKPHKALQGETPAQAAGIGVDGENKWMELLKKSLEVKRDS
ncbi:MAG: DDE-type integrase/transposase/recombinase [Thaumarchaeota archaeon]|nr:DDE-type integrase/transposase/recombinase [Nitrososphaerota archaeon]